MNLLLLNLNPLGKSFQIGLSYISASLKKRGHKVIFSSLAELDKKSIESLILKEKIELVLMSLTTNSFELCREISIFIKKRFNLPILLGGIHPTIFPEKCLEIEGVLGICIGEGEYPSAELAECIEKGKDYTRIKNLWIKKGDSIYKNEIRPLIKNLDILPYPDYSLFKDTFDFEIPVMLSRGCPYNCSYCCNHTLHRIYHGKGSILRAHSVDYSIRLIKSLLKQFPKVNAIEFFDDTFTIDLKWLKAFLKEFSKLGIKFACNTRFDLINEDLIRLLSESGCKRINVAIECGNEKIRKMVLKRNISNEEIISKSKIIKKYGIKMYTHNMVGLPYETKKNILETIALNKKVQPDFFQVSIFNPYPKTDLGELCIAKKWVNSKKKAKSYWDFTELKTPFIKPHLVNYYFLAFKSMVKNSGFKLRLKKILFWILHLDNNRLYLLLRQERKEYSPIEKLTRRALLFAFKNILKSDWRENFGG